MSRIEILLARLSKLEGYNRTGISEDVAYGLDVDISNLRWAIASERRADAARDLLLETICDCENCVEDTAARL